MSIIIGRGNNWKRDLDWMGEMRIFGEILN